MDIGDPNEIPATRRKLPSMQELGAFDFGAAPPGAEPPSSTPVALDSRPAPLASPPATGTAARRPPAAPTSPDPATRPAELQTVPASPPPSGVGVRPASEAPSPRPTLTPDQLRQALAKADPQTRQKLMRLIAGGRTVQQLGPAGQDGARKRSLVMQLDAGEARARPQAPAAPATGPGGRPASAAPASGFGAFTAPAVPPPRTDGRPPPAPGYSRSSPTARQARQVEPALMQIDEHTDLLDAAAPPAPPDPRTASLQAQLEQVQRQAAAPEPARSEPLAHKVLFPAYDPSRHGDDVHGHTRRRHEGPIEGHFPAPRQPFQPTYRHADGRPMTVEETQVEEVLQTQRCEETLSVLARDGVNGLLLSPRDLDAAVANGVLDAETAATLWKTWAALRPVIHVIDDEPAAAADNSAPAQGDPEAEGEPTGDGPVADGDVEGDVPGDAVAADTPADAPADAPAEAAAGASPGSRVVPTVVDAVESTAEVMADPVRPVLPEPVPAEPPEADPPTLPLPRATAAAPVVPPASPVTPVVETTSAFAPMAVSPPVPTPPARRTDPPSTPGGRLKALARLGFWLFVAYCVLATSARLAMWAWVRWGHWFAA